jgi:uncharacterized LabA/DUF88 family protein
LTDKGHNPIDGKFVDFSQTPTAKRQTDLLEDIKKTPNMALRLGHSVWRNNAWTVRPDKMTDFLKGKIDYSDIKPCDVIPVIEQKIVDIKIGLDIAWICTKKLADCLIIITGDSDFVPAMKLARREGMRIGLDSLGQKVHSNLLEHIDFTTSKLNQWKEKFGRRFSDGRQLEVPAKS